MLKKGLLKSTYFSAPRNLFETAFILHSNGVGYTVSPIIKKHLLNTPLAQALLEHHKDKKAECALTKDGMPLFVIKRSVPKIV